MNCEIPMLIKQAGVAIVNNLSTPGIRGAKRLSFCSAGKPAVLGFTKAFALEVDRRKVKLNAVCPDFVRNARVEDMLENNLGDRDTLIATIPIKRRGIPEEIADLFLWLCWNTATFMIGKEVVVAGGHGMPF